jgi:membrane-associated phospholipid phosphatase
VIASEPATRFSGFVRDRHPGDVLRLVLGTLFLLLTASAVDPNHLGRLETNVFRLINDFPLPAVLDPVVWLVMQLGNLAAVPIVALAAMLARRWRLAWDFLTAGGTIYVIALVVKAEVERGRPQAYLDNVHTLGEAATGLGYVSGHSAVAVALATVAGPYLGRRGRRVAWVLAALVCVFRIYAGAHLPWDVVGGAALGWMAGAVAHLILGAPEGHPTPERLRRMLSQWGWSLSEVRSTGSPTRRSASFYVRDASGGEYFAKILSRERRDDDFLFRAWRLVRDRTVLHAPDFGSPLRQAEHEALMALMARSHGARVPDVVLARSFGNGGAVLMQGWVDARPLDELRPDEIDEGLRRDLSAQLDLLRKGCIAHGELTGRNVIVDARRRVWLTNFAAARQVSDMETVERDGSGLLAMVAPSPPGTGREEAASAPGGDGTGETHLV